MGRTMFSKLRSGWTGILLVLLLFPTMAFGNIGIPVIGYVWPVFWLTFIPIVIIEGYVIKRALKEYKVDSRDPWDIALSSNLVSTLIGIPLTWVLLVLVQYGIGYILVKWIDPYWPKLVQVVAPLMAIAWLPPLRGDVFAELYAICAFMILLVPFFWASYRLEEAFAWIWFKERNISRALSRKIIRRANFYSYMFLFVLLAGLFAQVYLTSSSSFFYNSFFKSFVIEERPLKNAKKKGRTPNKRP